MSIQGFNPYLPSWEYVPDGEPHVFGDRVYVYGSHDRFNGHAFCLNDYVCYSAPVNDLRLWRYEGVIYGRGDDPRNADGQMCMYAPDVTRGTDGRYYLYYVLDALPVVSVAVCDTPAGRYRFLDYVRYEDGTPLGEKEGDEAHFDPGVLTEDGKVYLYTGSCAIGRKDRHGPMVTVLKGDMLTVAEAPRFIAPSEPYSAGSGYEGHEYYEAASIRKVKGKYCFVYSSIQMHELCYALSDKPTEGFRYMGTIVSNIDVGINSYKAAERPMGCYIDNNHGGIEEIGGQWYVFYHRHTNGNSLSRQGCLEPIQVLEDGTIPQVEISSCGPNGGPLEGKGEYPAYICCHLYGRTPIEAAVGLGTPSKKRDARFPILTQDGRDGDENPGYILNMDDGAVAGYKSFLCKGSALVSVTTRGWCGGEMEVRLHPDGEAVGSIPIRGSNEWKKWQGSVPLPDGVQALYLCYKGQGSASLLSFELKQA